jgi:hypothetical protein
LACKNYPWPNRQPRISKEPVHPKKYNENLSDAWANFIFKAIQPKKENRFTDAEQMLQELEKIQEEKLIQLPGEKTKKVAIDQEIIQGNFVDYLNSLFSQSKNGNAGTRASVNTSVFDQLTYVDTKLDTVLLPGILDGNYKLIIITGNAGDGKTAFIRRVEEKANNCQQFQNKNGASFTIKGTQFISNYDGSQDEDEKANDQVLEEFFLPFENKSDFSTAQQGRIIAINEGRLADFLIKSGKHKCLESTIEEYFHEEGNAKLPEGLLIINLNLRSVVASNSEKKETSILRKQLHKFTNPRLWDKCQNCKQKEHCFINFNVQSFNDPAAGNEVIHRLEWLIRSISFKRELHITIRDLRSFLAWAITRDFTCEEIKANFQEGIHASDYWKNLYFNMTAPQSDNASSDRLIKLLRDTDIATTAVPAIDRDLYFTAYQNADFNQFENRYFDIIDSFNQNKIMLPAHEQTIQIREQIRRIHQAYRRHHFFEGKKMNLQRLPYQSIFNFFDLIKKGSDDKIHEAIKGLSKAIALNEGCENSKVYQDAIILSAAHVKDPMAKSFRKFPIHDFQLKVNNPEHLVSYIEYEPDSLIFKHTAPNCEHVKLVISLDLYEMLEFIGKGFSPSLNDLKGRYIELQIFKNLLENLDYKELLITKDNLNFYRISKQEQGKLKLETVNVESI